jgi:hypothetical protein
MSRNYNCTVHLPLPEYGQVTAEVTYYFGFSGSYHQPPDSDEIVIRSIHSEDGKEIFLTDEEHETYYDLFLEPASVEASNYFNEIYNGANSPEEE